MEETQPIEDRETNIELPKEEEKSDSGASDEATEAFTSNLVEDAKKAAIEINKANEEKKRLLEREEKLLARQEALKALGGGSSAGHKTEEKKELTPAEYRKMIESGIVPERK